MINIVWFSNGTVPFVSRHSLKIREKLILIWHQGMCHRYFSQVMSTSSAAFLSRLFIFQTRYSLRMLLEWVTWEYITNEHFDSMMENNVMYSFNQSLPEIGLLENILLVSIFTVWWKTISCTASTSLYLKCAGIVTWDVVLNVIFMFAISPWVFWGELYCVFLWTPNGKEYKFLLVCHRNLFCIFSNLSQFFQSVWLFLSCLSLIMIAVLALF